MMKVKMNSSVFETLTTLPATVVTAPPAVSPDCEAFYGELDAKLADETRKAAVKIHDYLGRSRDAYIDAGRELLLIKEKLQHGQFGKWLATEFDLTDRSAQNFMNAAKLADSNPKLVSDLPTTAVYKLAAPSTPKTVIDEVEARISNGDAPSVKEIDDSIYVAKQKEAEAALKRRDAQAAADRKTASRARADTNKSPEEIEKANKRRAAADKRQQEKRQREIEAAQREREEEESNAHKAVAFLRDHLGNKYSEFHALMMKVNIFEFRRALEGRSKPVTKQPDPGPANDPGVKGCFIIEELDLKEDLVEDLDLPDAA